MRRAQGEGNATMQATGTDVRGKPRVRDHRAQVALQLAGRLLLPVGPWPDGAVGPGGSIQWEGGGKKRKEKDRRAGAASGGCPAPPFGVVFDAPTRHVRRCRPGSHATTRTCASCRIGPDRTDHRPRGGRREPEPRPRGRIGRRQASSAEGPALAELTWVGLEY
ncbi:hypothetical protein SEVIR_9G368450v4 [Setaria viridis]